MVLDDGGNSRSTSGAVEVGYKPPPTELGRTEDMQLSWNSDWSEAWCELRDLAEEAAAVHVRSVLEQQS